MVMSLLVTVVFRYTHTQIIMRKSNHPNIIDVINHFYNTVMLEYIKEHILKRKSMNVSNMVTPFFIQVHFN